MRVTSEVPQWDRLISVLGDEYSVKMIAKTMDVAMSAHDLSVSTQIPLSTVYRRIEQMKKYGLLEVEKIILGDNGRKEEFVRGKCMAFSVDLSGSDIAVHLDLARESAYHFGLTFQVTM